ncbi:MAG: hypothetical protein AB1631_31635, partial [Acidobacteriota bacterium]
RADLFGLSQYRGDTRRAGEIAVIIADIVPATRRMICCSCGHSRAVGSDVTTPLPEGSGFFA